MNGIREDQMILQQFTNQFKQLYVPITQAQLDELLEYGFVDTEDFIIDLKECPRD